MKLGRLILLWHMCWAGTAAATPNVRICVPPVELWPFAYQQNSKGSVIDTLHLAAVRANLTLKIETYPTRRCHELVRSGAMDGTLQAYSKENSQQFLFPDDAVDGEKAGSLLVNLRAAVFRRKDSQANWDGERFSNVEKIGIPHDYLVLKHKLGAYSVKVDENNFSAEQQLHKLRAKRFDLMITHPEYLAQPRGRLNESAAEIEMLPQLFLNAHIYLAFSRASVKTQQLAPALWQSIRNLGDSGESLLLLQQAQSQAIQQ